MAGATITLRMTLIYMVKNNSTRFFLILLPNSYFLLRSFCFLLLASCFLLLSSCATQQTPMKKFTPKPKVTKERVQETGAKKEIIRTEPKPFASSSTPKARASLKMVEIGRAQLANENFAQAGAVFQDAINVDPTNGIAYYYLAKAKYELGDTEQALGVLDKAEQLLSGSKEWMEAVSALRGLIKE